MPRKARLVVPGAIHHIMSRGIEGRAIFRSDADRASFLSLLERGISRSGHLLHAWALMENHYHLVLRASEQPLGIFMRSLNGQYAQFFRKNAGSRGYLFQDRYKSIVTQDQDYVEQLVRYVHLNPLRAGVCASIKALDTYPWCGHATILGNHIRAFQNTTDVLARFGGSRAAAVKNYSRFIEAGIGAKDELVETVRAANKEAESIHHTGCWVIGNRDFVKKSVERDRSRRIGLAAHAKQGVSLDDIATKVAAHFGLAAGDLSRRGRHDVRSTARKAVAHIARQDYGVPVVDIARFFGIRPPSVSEMLREGAAAAAGIT